jgi:putative hydrolase of the HAD superfamily
MSNQTPDLTIEWKKIDTILLDMDGTLLDLRFDNYFWRQHVPQRYAEKHDLSVGAAREELYRRYGSVRGTIQWYSVDYWTEELDLDIALLKKEVDHLIAVHPHAVEFLIAVRKAGKRTVLVTNAHGKSLDLKMGRTELGKHLDSLVCAHDLGIPKEKVEFWGKLKKLESFLPDRTLLIDDNPEVLASARSYGIRFLLALSRPDTQGPVHNHEDFETFSSFAELSLSLRSSPFAPISNIQQPVSKKFPL